MEIQQIHHFLAAAVHRNLNRAAEACHITQPALTRSIQRLEERLGVRLLVRSSQGVEPTRAGQIVEEFAQRIVRDTRELHQRLDLLKSGTLQELRIGIASNFAHAGLSVALASAIRQWPDCRITIVQDFYAPLLDRLGAGELDLVVSLVPEADATSDVIREHLTDVQAIMIVGASHPLAGRRTVSAAELGRYRWIAPSLDELEGYLQRKFSGFGLEPPQIAVRTASPGVMKELLSATPMVGLVPSHLFALELREGILKRLDTEFGPLIGKACVLQRRRAEAPVELERFLGEFRAIYREVLRRAEM